MIDVTAFRSRFPEFTSVIEFPDIRVQLFIDDSTDIHIGTDELRWNGKYDYAQAYLVAHLLTAGTKTEAGDANAITGSIKSKSAGGVSVTRGGVDKDRSASDEVYATTSYGLVFIATRNRCFIGGMAATQ